MQYDYSFPISNSLTIYIKKKKNFLYNTNMNMFE